MIGCRPLSDSEIELVSKSFSGKFEARDRALFVLGVRTGFRVSELLSLRVGDVRRSSDSEIVSAVTVAKRNTKGKKSGRTVPLHAQAREALAAWLGELPKLFPSEDANALLSGDAPLFRSRKAGAAMSRVQAHRVLKAAAEANGLEQVATHSMRKTFAKRVHEKTGRDLLAVKEALGHANIESTTRYLSFNRDKLNAAILAD